jgi:hypothetical protein
LQGKLPGSLIRALLLYSAEFKAGAGGDAKLVAVKTIAVAAKTILVAAKTILVAAKTFIVAIKTCFLPKNRQKTGTKGISLREGTPVPPPDKGFAGELKRLGPLADTEAWHASEATPSPPGVA